MSGYDFTSHGKPVLSITTAESNSGQQDTFLHLRGVDTHEHLWIPIPGGLDAAGHRLKSNGSHINSASSVAMGAPFARARIAWPEGSNVPVIELCSLNPGSATTAATVGLRPARGQREAVPLGNDGSSTVSVEFALLPREADVRSVKSFGRLEWGSSVGWVLGWRAIP